MEGGAWGKRPHYRGIVAAEPQGMGLGAKTRCGVQCNALYRMVMEGNLGWWFVDLCLKI